MLGLGLTAMLSGCVTGGSLEVLCDRTLALEADHAAALAITPDDAAVMTGQAYVSAVAAACGRA
jgi:hypothetical protein